ncbi:MAG: porin family protein [Sulfurimonas sp.]|jgi:opacity protein-like surface antigen|nr:porin family protein [Sulfurimonas sp.]
MMKLLLGLLVTLSALYADRDGGPYLGLGYASSTYKDDGFYGEIKEDKAQSPLFYAGAYINKHLSVEFSYADLGSYEITDTQEEDISAYHISTLAHYPLWDDKIDLYAKFGVGELSLKSASKSGFTYVYGVGTAYRFNKYLALRVAYERYNFSYEDTINVQSYDMTVDTLYGAFEVQF